MGKRLKTGILLLNCFLFFLVPGCWGARETDGLGYVLSMGIDKGKENILQVTFQIAMPQAPGGNGGGEKGRNTEIVSLEAASLFGALQLANAFVSRDVTLIHNRAVIISEELAREGMSKYINPLIRSREIRRNTFLIVTRGQAREFIEKNQPLLEKNPSRHFELLLEGKHFTGFIPDSTINDFTEGVKSPGKEAVTSLAGVNEGNKGEERGWNVTEKARQETAYLPGTVPRVGGNKIEFIGLAVFRGDRLVGFLNGSQTRYYQMAAGMFESAVFTFPDPRYPQTYIISMEVRKGRNPDIHVDLSQEVPRIQIDQVLEGEIMSIQSGESYETGENERELEEYIAGYISREVTNVVKAAQREFGSDIFGFGNYTRRYFWTWEDWVNYSWLERFPTAEVRVNTIVAIRRTGLMAKTVPIASQKGGE